MKFLFHLGHPAHFHLFKNTISFLKNNSHKVIVVIKKKDVLEDLLIENDIEYINILPNGRKDGLFFVALGQLKQNYYLYKIVKKEKPDLMIGTSVSISHVGKLLGIPSFNFSEDDADIVPLYSKLAYPWATRIITPNVCSVGKWENKKIGYNGYHELAYLHPENFTPSKEIANQYINTDVPYFILRFAKLSAHHDVGVKGLSNELAVCIVEILKKHGRVYISSERELNDELEKYRIKIKSKDIHHIMAFCELYIGDSQTMAVESGVLGVPFIRYNDFVGRISCLEELEKEYQLGYGVKPSEDDKLIQTINNFLELPNRREIFKQRRINMLKNTINVSTFINDLIVNFKKHI